MKTKARDNAKSLGLFVANYNLFNKILSLENNYYICILNNDKSHENYNHYKPQITGDDDCHYH